MSIVLAAVVCDAYGNPRDLGGDLVALNASIPAQGLRRSRLSYDASNEVTGKQFEVHLADQHNGTYSGGFELEAIDVHAVCMCPFPRAELLIGGRG